jgi:transcriptional regulator with XRE-family HTH domain
MTQAELAGLARITASYVYRLENSLVSPGIDLVERLAESLGTKVSDLLPEVESGDALPLLQDRAQGLFGQLMKQATREDLLMLCPLLARLVESPTRKR